jgi:predicted RNA-binding Zn-ribbon protein involved in translation (DUF1610 family)
MTEHEIKSKLAPILTGPKILKDADYNVLRPCPFCGNYPSQKIRAVGYGYGIYCDTCEFIGPFGSTTNLSKLAWNTRGGK